MPSPDERDDVPMSIEEDRELLEMLEDIGSRLGDTPVPLEAPPSDLWSTIEPELSQPPVTPMGVTSLPRSESTVTSLDHHRRNRRPAGILLAAVAASVIAAVIVGTALRSSETTVAEVALLSLDSGTRWGQATIVEDGDSLRLDVDLSKALPTPDGDFYELWIIDENVQEMHSLGRISTDGSFDVPTGVAVTDFPIVDISVEADDGDATHSGNSVCRGVLET